MVGSRRKQTAQSCLCTVTNGAVHPGEAAPEKVNFIERESKERKRKTRALPELQKASAASGLRRPAANSLSG